MRSRRKYSLARRTTPVRLTSILAIFGECSGNLRSTPSPPTIRRTMNISRRARAAAGDHHAVENLDALLLAFQNSRVHVDRVADLELGDFGLQAALFDRVRRICWLMALFPFVIVSLTRARGLQATLAAVARRVVWMLVCFGSRAGRIIGPLVSCSCECFACLRQRAICWWLPLSSTSGTSWPRYSRGRVYCANSSNRLVARKRILPVALLVSQHAGHQPDHGVDHDHRRHFAAAQDEVADRNFVRLAESARTRSSNPS